MDFKNFVEKIISKANNGFEIILSIYGDKKKVKAMAEYETISGLQYIKIIFEDKSFLYFVPNEEEIFYSKNYIIETGIKDEQVGNEEEIEFNGKKYYLDNKNDYQFVKKLFIGGINDIEGEVKFSDYVPEKGNDFLSLGWVVYNNKRADIHPEEISMENIFIV